MKVAVLGAGYFAQFHYDAWRRIPEVSLVGACDQEIEKAAATAAPAFDNLSEMLERTNPDILDIAVPPDAHLAAIHEGLKAGLRAIICQKPFCTSLSQAQMVTQAAEDAGVPLIIHENFRFQPWYRLMKQRMEAGDVGVVLQTSFRLRTADGQGPRAYLDRQPYFQTMPRLLVHETGVHFIDVFRYLMGRPKACYADLRRMNPVIAGEDAGVFILDFDNDARAIFDGNRLLDHAAENVRVTLGEAVIEGTTGTLTLNGDGSVHLRGFGQPWSEEILPPDARPGFAGDCVHALCAHLIHGLKAGQLENTARDYLEVLEIEEALYKSATEGRKIVL